VGLISITLEVASILATLNEPDAGHEKKQVFARAGHWDGRT